MKFSLLLCGLLFSLISCATAPMASKEADTAAKAFIPPDGLANIYIVRLPALLGDPLSYDLSLDGKVIGSIAPGTFYLVTVEPGHHSISASSKENIDIAKIDTLANTIYFVQVSIALGLTTYRASIKQIDETKGKEYINQSKRAEGLID